MKARILATISLLVVATVVTILANRNSARLRQFRADTGTLAAARVKLEQDTAKLALDVEEGEREVARLQAMNPAATPTTASESLPPLITPPASPEEKHERTLSSWLKLRNRPLYARLNLLPGQSAQFERMEADHWLRVQDILATARAQGLAPTDPVIAALGKEEQTRFEREQLELLGPALDQQVKDFRRLLPARALANALAGNSIYGDALTAEQGERMTQILADNSPSYRKGGMASTNDLNLDQTFAQLQLVLTPAQLALFKKTFLALQSLGKINPLIAAEMKKAAAPKPEGDSAKAKRD